LSALDIWRPFFHSDDDNAEVDDSQSLKPTYHIQVSGMRDIEACHRHNRSIVEPWLGLAVAASIVDAVLIFHKPHAGLNRGLYHRKPLVSQCHFSSSGGIFWLAAFNLRATSISTLAGPAGRFLAPFGFARGGPGL
jgi:hypothetical protein